MVKKGRGELRRLTIEGYASDGAGVARLDGQAVFVKGALRGEVCDVELLKVGKSAAWGRVAEVVTPSPARQAPDCPYFPACGGCQLRHMTYEEELEMKRARVEEALCRIGGVSFPVPPVLGAGYTEGYRNKVQFPVSEDGIGFYRARSHQVIDVDACRLQPVGTAAIRRAVKEWMAASGAAPYDERSHTGLVRHLYVRFSGTRALVCLVINGTEVPDPRGLKVRLRMAYPPVEGILLNENTRRTNVILGERYRTLWGADHLDDILCGLTFRLSVPSFYQVNRSQAEVLYEKALDMAALSGRETVLDLYCGVGTITLLMAGRAGRAIGAEIVPAAVEDARANALRNGISNAEFLCADAGEAANALALRGIRPDVICVDPPRKGLSPQVIAAISSMAPARLVYVSCDPGTLARDIKRLTAEGYCLREAAAVDLFPRTAHVETCVLLSHKNS